MDYWPGRVEAEETSKTLFITITINSGWFANTHAKNDYISSASGSTGDNPPSERRPSPTDHKYLLFDPSINSGVRPVKKERTQLSHSSQLINS